LRAVLAADHVTQDATEQADVFEQGALVAAAALGGRFRSGRGRVVHGKGGKNPMLASGLTDIYQQVTCEYFFFRDPKSGDRHA
jgi:hypothetical protein